MSPPLRLGTFARGVLAFSVLTVALSGCARRTLQPDVTDVTGLVAPLQFTMTDQAGRPVSAAAFSGDVVLLYFGYTHCPDACPATLTTLAGALNLLGTDASRVRVLFVTVDPRRDTTSVLKNYVNDFGPRFVGLRGTNPQLTAMIKRYRVSYHDEPPDTHGNYEVDHSSATFVFDGHGQARLLIQSGASAEAIAADLRGLLRPS